MNGVFIMAYTENPIQVLRKFATKINDEPHDNNDIELKVDLSDAILPFSEHTIEPLAILEPIFDMVLDYVADHSFSYYMIPNRVVFGDKSCLNFN
jgi:hypothetical protein